MRWIHINIGGYFVHPNSGTHHSDNHRIQRKEGSLANDTRGLGKVSSFKKFYLIRQLSKKQHWPVWRKVTLRPPGLLWMPPSPAVVTIKRPAIQPSPSLSTHFSINMKMAKESQTQIYFINLHQAFNGKTPLRSSFKWFALLAKSWNLVSSEAYRDLRIWKLASMKWIVSNKRLVLKGAKWTTRI